ncbi:MAG: monovalent cation/H+ antiporter subunit D [Burkholderiaceae bacterium]
MVSDPIFSEHAIAAPIVLPLLAGAALVPIEGRWPRLASALSLSAVLALLALGAALAAHADSGAVEAYLVGNWRAPFGIALALDRLSALMLMLTALVALGAALYACGGEASRGAHFHALLQFQLMGLNGAFLTADLFNLFVFFEVLLIASYGLLLHGGGPQRLKAAIHYVAFNLTGSALFLIAVSLLYGLAGTLNMADLAERVTRAPAEGAVLLKTAALLLLVVFSVKAALLPLYFWLPDTYSAAAAPVAALFAIMTKVGVYAIARVYTLVFGDAGGVVAQVAQPWLPWLALGTLALAAQGALAAARLRVLVAYLVVASAGTLLLALGLGTAQTVAAGLFYLINSTLVAAALFLLIDRIDAARGDAADALAAAPIGSERRRLGTAYFVLAIAVAGLPPLAGFLGKALLLQAAAASAWPVLVWAVVLASSFALIVALARAGSVVFWQAPAGAADRSTPQAPGAQRAALTLLTLLVVAVAAFAGPLADYTHAAAWQLFERRTYIGAVLGKQPAAPLWNPRQGMTK